jgi:hypothetical protein
MRLSAQPRRRLRWLLLAGALCACRDDGSAPIRIVAGASPSDEATLLPRASLAEYIEVTPSESAVLLTFSSEPRGCDAPAAPKADAVTLAIRLVLPGGSKLEPGSYPIALDPASAEKPHAQPTVKLRGRRYELRPGGELKLQQVELSPQGSLSGLLSFESPGDAEHAATRVSGHFLAHFCRINRLR